MSIWTEIVFNDVHVPFQNKAALNCVYKVIGLIKPQGVTLNGDIVDWATFSRHDRFSKPKCNWTDTDFMDKSDTEFAEAIKLLDTVGKLAPKARKRWMYSNHDQWLLDFIAESPKARQKLFGFEEMLDLKKRGYESHKYNHFSYLGKLRVTHGIYTGQNHAKKHVEAVGKSVLYGHVHDIQTYAKVTAEHDTHMAFSNGCLCDLNPSYLKDKPQNWSHGFAIVYVFPNGNFQVDLKRILNGRCVLDGQLIDGNT